MPSFLHHHIRPRQVFCWGLARRAEQLGLGWSPLSENGKFFILLQNVVKHISRPRLSFYPEWSLILSTHCYDTIMLCVRNVMVPMAHKRRFLLYPQKYHYHCFDELIKHSDVNYIILYSQDKKIFLGGFSHATLVKILINRLVDSQMKLTWWYELNCKAA